MDGFIQIKQWGGGGECEGSRPFCKRNMTSATCRIFISSAFRVFSFENMGLVWSR